MISGRKTSKNFKKKTLKNSKSSKQSKQSKQTRQSKQTKYSSSGKLKVLPPIDRESPHLSDYGYTLAKPEKDRKVSLKRASSKEGTLQVLRRLNLIRNYTAVLANKKKMNKDMEFMKDLYSKSKSKSKPKK